MTLVTHGHFLDREHFLENMFAPLTTRRRELSEAFFAPAVDVKDKQNHYEISAELPGVEKGDIQIHVQDGVLTLEAESRRAPADEGDGAVLRQERRYGKFQRSFNLGSDISESDISAAFKDGVLTLKAPKLVEPEPQARRIEVS